MGRLVSSPEATRRKCPHKLLDLFFLNNRGYASVPPPFLASARQGRRIIRNEIELARGVAIFFRGWTQHALDGRFEQVKAFLSYARQVVASEYGSPHPKAFLRLVIVIQCASTPVDCDSCT